MIQYYPLNPYENELRSFSGDYIGLDLFTLGGIWIFPEV